jgi:hypothetical protein
MRTMKPEFFKSRSLAKLPREARMTFAGLWTEADDFGNGIADERLLKGAIWPLDDDIEPLHVSAHLRMLAASLHIQLYEVGDERYFHIINFTKHQAAAYRRGEPKFPGPAAGQPLDPDPAHEDVQESAPCTPESAVTGNREQGTGKKNASHSSPRTRGTRIPDDFTVTEDMVTWARLKTPNVDGRRETEKFINYWQATSGQKAVKRDWEATWRNWMLNAAERAPTARPATNSTDAHFAALLSRQRPDDGPQLLALPGGA